MTERRIDVRVEHAMTQVERARSIRAELAPREEQARRQPKDVDPPRPDDGIARSRSG